MLGLVRLELLGLSHSGSPAVCDAPWRCRKHRQGLCFYGNKKTLNRQAGLDKIMRFYYHYNMARPLKDKELLLNVPLRIMLTADQKDLIAEAAKLDGVDVAVWVRPLILEAARRRIEKSIAKVKR
jgi:hypothetical protein